MLIYLASPYSDCSAVVRWSRHTSACRAAATLLRRGVTVFSPIVHGHELLSYNCPADHSFWMPHDLEILKRCDAVYVLTIPGWKVSVGVRREIAEARIRDIPVYSWDGASVTAETLCDGVW